MQELRFIMSVDFLSRRSKDVYFPGRSSNIVYREVRIAK